MHVNLGALQTHRYESYLGGKKTRWTALQLVYQQAYTQPPAPFNLDEGMFTAPIQFGKTGLLGHMTQVAYSPSVQAMIKGTKEVYGLVTEGCAPPILTFTVTYAANTQNVNNKVRSRKPLLPRSASFVCYDPLRKQAEEAYGSYAAPYSGMCNLASTGNGVQNPVPTSRRLLEESPVARRLLGRVDTMTCYRRTVVLSSVAIVPDTKCRMVRNSLRCGLSFGETAIPKATPHSHATAPSLVPPLLSHVVLWPPPKAGFVAGRDSRLASSSPAHGRAAAKKCGYAAGGQPVCRGGGGLRDALPSVRRRHSHVRQRHLQVGGLHYCHTRGVRAMPASCLVATSSGGAVSRRFRLRLLLRVRERLPPLAVVRSRVRHHPRLPRGWGSGLQGLSRWPNPE